MKNLTLLQRKMGRRSGTNRRSRNCVDLILDYCENNLGIESARTRVKIEKMYWLGKQKDDILKPRPVVVEFTKFADRELIVLYLNVLKAHNLEEDQSIQKTFSIGGKNLFH